MKTYLFQCGCKTKRIVADNILDAKKRIKQMTNLDYKFVCVEKYLIVGKEENYLIP